MVRFRQEWSRQSNGIRAIANRQGTVMLTLDFDTQFGLARALHVVGVVLWIGGVAFVTTVLLPATRGCKTPAERVDFFEAIEHRFAWQARFTTLLTGFSGWWLLYLMQAWSRFAQPAYWWLHAMVGVWVVFTLMLFVLEPWFLQRWFKRRATRDPVGTFRLIERLHRVLLGVSLATVLGAVAGAHGLLFQ
jgi:uncharacterized membrane protein